MSSEPTRSRCRRHRVSRFSVAVAALDAPPTAKTIRKTAAATGHCRTRGAQVNRGRGLKCSRAGILSAAARRAKIDSIRREIRIRPAQRMVSTPQKPSLAVGQRHRASPVRTQEFPRSPGLTASSTRRQAAGQVVLTGPSRSLLALPDLLRCRSCSIRSPSAPPQSSQVELNWCRKRRARLRPQQGARRRPQVGGP